MKLSRLKEIIREEIIEVSGYTLKPKDKKVFDEFLAKNFNGTAIKKSQGFSVESTAGGKVLIGSYTKIGFWKGDKLYIHNYAYGNVSQTYLNYITKAAKREYIDFEIKDLSKI